MRLMRRREVDRPGGKHEWIYEQINGMDEWMDQGGGMDERTDR